MSGVVDYPEGQLAVEILERVTDEYGVERASAILVMALHMLHAEHGSGSFAGFMKRAGESVERILKKSEGGES